MKHLGRLSVSILQGISRLPGNLEDTTMSRIDQYRQGVSVKCNCAKPVYVWKARKFIEEHSGEELSLRELAKAVKINPNYLSVRFKQVTGVNVAEHVSRTRYENACDLLCNSNRRISEIAFAVGFQSLSQFNRVFKKLSGKSPTQFRKLRQRGV
jgi:YesN/AraC family two-component response regulator